MKWSSLLEAQPPRRTRVLPVPSLAQALGSAEGIRHQIPVEEVPAVAQRLHRPIRARLVGVFGRGAVESRLKPQARLAQLKSYGVEAPTDLLGYRITVADWREVPEAVGRLQEAGLRVLGVTDTLGTPDAAGRRAVAVLAESAEAPGFVLEVEVGTPLFKVTRDASAAASKRLANIEARMVQIEEALARLKGETRPGVAEHIDRLRAERAALRVTAEKGRRYLQGIWEAVADEVEAHYTGKAMPGGAERRTMNRIRLWVERELVSPLIELGIMDLDGLFDRAYLPLRLRSGAAWDPEAHDFVGGRTSLDIDAERAVRGLPMPVYFPHIDARRAKPMDFLLGTTTVGMRKFAKPGFLERDHGYLFAAGEFEKDVLAAYSRRAARALKWRDTYDLVRKIANEFGRKISSVDELQPGERVFAPDGLLRFFSTNIGITDYYLRKITASCSG